MNLQELVEHENVLWTEKPNVKIYKARNVEWLILDYLKIIFLVSIAIGLLYVVVRVANKDIPQIDMKSIVIFYLAILLIKIYKLRLKFKFADKLIYFLTSKNVIIYSDLFIDKFKIIEFGDIQKIKMMNSWTDIENKLNTIKIYTNLIDSDGESTMTFYIESVLNSDILLKKMMETLPNITYKL